jgi:thiol:disulfide interchange protein DsbD
MQWTLPAGFKASEIHYPAPSLILSGPLAAYGYHGEILYPVTITPLENLSPGDQATIALKADWLVCRVECLPGSAELSLTLPVATGQPKLNESVRALFEKVERLRPQDLPNNWETQATVNESTIYLDLRPGHILETPVKLHFFADEKAIIEHAAEQPFDEIDGLYRVRLTRSPYSTEKPDSLTGTLAVTNDGSTDYFDLSIPFGANPAGVVSATAGESGINVGLALLFAFIGGLILNLMPCVLPVLSIKVLGLIGQANESRRSAVNHGLFFTLGVVATFWAIVATMLLLQAGGQQLGWGFQLQSPTFVMILATFMFLFALSLFGVFEISLFSGVGANGGRSKSGGMAGAFMSGITATLVATPCTAPFMGAALGYTLTQPAAVSLLVYTVLGLGMAFPYLLLSIFPNLLKFVPKPGRWMETFKQAMGFLLAATVIWLAWLLSSLAGVTALIALLGVLLFVAIAAWIYGRWGTVVSTSPVRWSSRIIAVLLVCVSLVAGNTGISTLATAPQRSAEAPSNGIAWKEYSDSYLEELLAQGRSVFIDFTAAWCLSCKVNERVAFSSEEVQGRFSELGIVPLVADWTHRSDEITEALARFGRNSVPLYVLYPAGDKADPILLPEILTPGIVLDALNKIDNLQPSQSIQTTERNQL